MHPTIGTPSRSALVGVPVVLSAGVPLAGAVSMAVALMADPTLGSGVPDAAMLGLLGLLVVALPAVVTAGTLVAFAVAGTWRLVDDRPTMLRTVAILVALVGAVVGTGAHSLLWQVLGLLAAASCLTTLAVLRRRTSTGHPAVR